MDLHSTLEKNIVSFHLNKAFRSVKNTSCVEFDGQEISVNEEAIKDFIIGLEPCILLNVHKLCAVLCS